MGALFQHLRDAVAVALCNPLCLGNVPGELGGALEDEHKPYIVDVCEQCASAAFRCVGLEPAGTSGTSSPRKVDANISAAASSVGGARLNTSR
jgi:hypothetical protein